MIPPPDLRSHVFLLKLAFELYYIREKKEVNGFFDVMAGLNIFSGGKYGIDNGMEFAIEDWANRVRGSKEPSPPDWRLHLRVYSLR
jgi:hypothetical protein